MEIYHVIDHAGRGTIHNLIFPLEIYYSNHHVCCPDEQTGVLDANDIETINRKADVVIIHTTGQMSKENVLSSCENKFPQKRIYVFIHTSAKYQKLKNRTDTLVYLRELSKKGSIQLMVPSKEVANQYIEWGIATHHIQLGIPSIQNSAKVYREDLAPFYNKIITTCGSEKDIYKYIKGIDKFEKLIKEMGLSDKAVIAGCSNQVGTGILCKRFSESDFLNILCHSLIYVQLSRYDTYNLTATQAKQLRIPVAVLACEGTISCMKSSVCYTEGDIAEKIILACMGLSDQEEIQNNYYDSIQRESIFSFKSSVERVCGCDETSEEFIKNINNDSV